MIMTTANGVIEQQNAESHDTEKNIFAEPRNDGERRVDDGERRVDDGNRVRRGHADRLVENDPAVDVALVASRLIVLARLLGVTRIVVAAAFASFVAGATLVVATQLI